MERISEVGRSVSGIVNEIVNNPYDGRESTQAKHFILEQYLRALAFKILRINDLTYVDGFSGPWMTATEDFSDSSFMIAIKTLKDAQEAIRQSKGTRPNIRCFFSESKKATFIKLESAVRDFHDPDNGFSIRTYSGRFEDAVDIIREFVGSSFPLIFIDPKGWTGYPLDKIKPLFSQRRCEVLINFMFDHVKRFSSSIDEATVQSFDPILGGPGWQERLDPCLPYDLAIEKLFRETLKDVGNFEYVASTGIHKATMDKTHYFITYGTKHLKGLMVFRDTEYKARRFHERNRANAKDRERAERTRMGPLFPEHQADVDEANVENDVNREKILASDYLEEFLSKDGQQRFDKVVGTLLERYQLRETHIKDVCVDLAKSGKIENTWGNGNRKPSDESMIRMKVVSEQGPQ